MEFRVLGAVEVIDGARSPALTAAKHQALLVACLLNPGGVTSVARLVDGLWGERPPATAVALVHSHVSALRRALGRPGVLVTRSPGYLMNIEPDQVDVHRFTTLAARGQEDAAQCRHSEAARTLRAALDLWRGPAFGGVGESFLRAEATRLEEMRLTVLEERIAAELRLARSRDLVPELAGLVAGHPLRERLRGQLMLALNQEGRQAEALEVYQEGRRALAEELGLEPNPELRRLHQAILAGDRGLAAAPGGLSASGPLAASASGQVMPVLSEPVGSQSRLPAVGASSPGVLSSAATAPGQGSADSREEASPESASPEAGSPGRAAPPPRVAAQVIGARDLLGARVPAELPPAVADLVGRDRELGVVHKALRERGAAVRVCVVTGMPGSGKTALAVAAAHALRSEFLDGQLYVDLHGSTPEDAIRPGDVLGKLLSRLGADSARIPGCAEARAACFRSLLSTRRLLLVLDDAATEEQVRPLLPGCPEGAVLITSRRPLPGLEGAARPAAGTLDPGDGLDLLTRLVGAPRVEAEPDAAELVVRMCGGLPLAIRAVGTRLGMRPSWSLSLMARRLADERRRLDELAAGDLAVRPRLATGYRSLPERERALLRRIGRLGRRWFRPEAVAALPGADACGTDAEEVTARLADARLLESGVDDDGLPRYRCHDLVRIYVRERLEIDEESSERDLNSAPLVPARNSGVPGKGDGSGTAGRLQTAPV